MKSFKDDSPIDAHILDYQIYTLQLKRTRIKQETWKQDNKDYILYTQLLRNAINNRKTAIKKMEKKIKKYQAELYIYNLEKQQNLRGSQTKQLYIQRMEKKRPK